jgi:hypothetical protein
VGGGLMIFEDGAVYEGEFCGAGEFSGKGVLTTATDKFEGIFHGNYADRMKFNGVVVKQAQTPGYTAASDKVRQHTVPAYKKWTSIFHQLDNLLGTENNCWEQVAIAINVNKVRARESSSSGGGKVVATTTVLDSLEMIPEVGRPGVQLDWTSYGEVSVADPGCFIPDRDPTIAPSRIRGVKNHQIPGPTYFCIKAINKFCLLIPDPDPTIAPSRIRGIKKHRIPDPQHWARWCST